MGKDRKARVQGRVTIIALANLVAALVDTMRECRVANDVVHNFLDRFDERNWVSLSGAPAAIMDEIIGIVRRSVPGND